MKKLHLYALVLFIANSYGQGENNFWYLGNAAGVNFANGAFTTTPTPVYNANGSFTTADNFSTDPQDCIYSGGSSTHLSSDEGGCATVCKPDGSLLFYTNGKQIYNKNHVVMTTSLPGNYLYTDIGSNSKQAVVIIPKPGNSNQYYVISSCPPILVNSGDKWSYFIAVVDFSTNPNGQVISSGINFSPYCSGNQSLTVTKDLSGTGFWILIAKGSQQTCSVSDRLAAFKVDNTGISTTPVINLLDFNINYYSEVKVSQAKNPAKVCIANSFQGNFNVNPKTRVYAFDRATGQIPANPLFSFDGLVLSTEFSSDGNLLYAIIVTNPCYSGCGNYTPLYRLVVFDLNNPTAPYRLLSNNSVFGSLQRAVDGNIYFTNKTNLLYKIDNQTSFSGSAISASTINLSNGPAGTRCSLFGLPQLVPTFGWPTSQSGSCEASLTLNSEPNTGTFTYQDYLNITTQTSYNVSLATQNISLKAKNNIYLKAGTKISAGTVFSAKIDTCFISERSAYSGENGGIDEGDILSKDNAVKLFPNPNKGSFTIWINQEVKDGSLSVFDIFGKLVYETKVSESQFELNIPNIPAGMYLVRLSSSTINKTLKFVKE